MGQTLGQSTVKEKPAKTIEKQQPNNSEENQKIESTVRQETI